MENTKLIKNYTEGNLPKQMLRFALPFMLSNALQVLYAIVDMAVVGKVIGGEAIAAVSSASQAVTLMTMLCMGFATGGQVLISQLVGAKKREELNSAIGTLFFIVFVVGTLMSAIALLFCKQILTAMNTPTEAYEMATQYLYICGGGLIFAYGYNTVSALLRGLGNAKQPLIFIIIATVTNIVFDLLFVLVFDMGVVGAAVATVIGQAVSFITAVIYLIKRKSDFGFDFKPKSFLPEKKTAKALLELGVPLALRSGAVNLSMIFVTSLVNGLGVAEAAVFGVGLKVDDIVRKISLGITYSVSTFVGQNFAAKRFDRVNKTFYCGWLFSFGIYLIYCVVCLTNVRELFGLFTNDQGVLSLAPVFMSAIIWSFPAMITMRPTNGFVQGIGNTTLSFIFALIDGFVLRIGLSYLLGVVFGMGFFGFVLGYGLATYGTSVPGLIYFLSGVWKKRKPKI